MVDVENEERKRRIKEGAQLSLAMARLPPRMEAHEKERNKLKGSKSVDRIHEEFSVTFKAKEVPDFGLL
jgi:hypothetical protein